jgi:hypothetical protein
MRDLAKFLPLLVFIFVAVSIARNALRVAKRISQQPPSPLAAGGPDPEMTERTRRIQEEIRRKIAERRGATAATEALPVGPGMEPPIVPLEQPAEPVLVASDAAVLERQKQLADQLRRLEESRVLSARRVAQVTADLKTESESERGMFAASHGELLADLRDPVSLRRAFVLREVLGPPVGLR